MAYINGEEVARAGIGKPGEKVNFDQPANGEGHEAQFYQGGQVDGFLIDSVFQYLIDGENTLAIQVHNSTLFSSDLSAIPIFTLGVTNSGASSGSVSNYIQLKTIGLHTNFKISSEGEHLSLNMPDGGALDALVTGVIPADVSFGRKGDGNDMLVYFNQPTPGSANVTRAFQLPASDTVFFSVQGGFYAQAQPLILQGGQPADSIYYTLDGSEPSFDDALFDQPVFIAATTTIRARVLRHGYLPGTIFTQTYFVGNKSELPVVAVTTDPYNLWDHEYGIYAKGSSAQPTFPYFGANFWEDWERPAHIAMYEPDGMLAFQLDAGIKIFGNWTRGNDQKSLAVYARKRYGNDRIRHKIFDEKDIQEFESIVLRNSGNDFKNTMFRDALNNAIVKDLRLDHQAYRPVVVYINGEYWGIQNIREKISETFLASNHGIENEGIDIQENAKSKVESTSEHYERLIDFVKKSDLAYDQNYSWVKSQMDVDNFIKYQIAQIFIDNRDWPGNNIKYWRVQADGSKWCWIFYDTDFGLNIWSNTNQTFNTLQFAMEANGPEWPNPPWSTLLMRKLTENQQFRYDFINCFADQLNSIFLPQVTLQKLQSMKAGIEPEIGNHLQRWNGDMWYWNDRINAMSTFLRERPAHVRNHITSVFRLTGTYKMDIGVRGNGSVKLNTLHLSKFPWSGSYYKKVPVQLEAVPAPGYRFVSWEGGQNADNEKLLLNATESQSLVAVFEPAELQPGQVVINEINYNSHADFDAGDWIELHNISNRSINLSGWVLTDDNEEHRFELPGNTVIAGHGFLVVCKDKTKFGSVFPEVATVQGVMDFGLGSSDDCMRLLNVSGLIEDEVCYEGNAPWPIEANAGGATLALENALSNNNHPNNWLASTRPGSPGKANYLITHLEESEHLQAGAQIFPNPIGARFNLYISSTMQETMQIKILNLSGQVISSREHIGLRKGDNILSLDSPMAPGVYIVVLNSSTRREHIKVLKR